MSDPVNASDMPEGPEKLVTLKVSDVKKILRMLDEGLEPLLRLQAARTITNGGMKRRLHLDIASHRLMIQYLKALL